ncbi:MAG: DUF4390 domain-containing protein [Pseudomonadota bacterium]
MRCCTSGLKALLFALLLACVSAGQALADGISVTRAEMRAADEGYYLSVDFGIAPNFVIEQALTRGVTLYFVTEFTLNRPRWYWFDEAIVQTEQVTKLSYNPLTRQYRLSRGSLYQNFSKLEDAIRMLGHQTTAPVSASAFKKGANLVASVRLRLDVTQLPKPLQVSALTGKDWNLDSDWYRWFVNPDTAEGRGD